MTFGNQNTIEESEEQMDYALDSGVNFFDTAELYPVPASPERYADTEKIIGAWMKKKSNRDKIILATKIAGPGDYTKHIRTTGFSEESLFEAVDGSLKRLKTDYIDLYQLHWPERKVNSFGKLGYVHEENEWNQFEDVLGELNKYVSEGKIRYVGLSNETPWGTMSYLKISKDKNLPRMMSVQNPYNLLNRSYEVGLAEISVRDQSGLLAYSPLAFGFLTGKYRNNTLPERSRMKLFGDQFPRYKTINASKAIEEYYKISKEFNLVIDFSQGLSYKAAKTLKFDSLKLLIKDGALKERFYSELKGSIDL